MGELRLALLGKLEIQRDGAPVAGLTSAKAQALLCYLAVTRRPHFRTSLAGLLWGDMPEANARTNLRRELSALGRTLGENLTITRQEVAFNRDAPYSLDVEVFESGAGYAAQSAGHLKDIERLREAVALYRGDFLEGFYVRDAPAFEEWVLVQQTRLRELALHALHKLSVHYAEQGEPGFEAGIKYTSRLLALEPSREEAHRQLMLLLAQSGKRGAALAQYEDCRQTLGEDLGVEPGPETRELYERIRDGIRDGEIGRRSETLPIRRRPQTLPSRNQKEPTAALPRFLTDEGRDEVERPVFVTRERELAQLDEYLNQALTGQGQVAFITGGPGRGKTALMTEFARRAMAAHRDLLVPMGACNAYSGVGDPYLPFREVLGMLTGDVEARWAAGVITRDCARRLWQTVPLALRALLDHGPYLIGTLVSGSALLSRATTAGESDNRLEQLRGWVERARDEHTHLQQDAMFEQYTNVLRSLTTRRPLLLLLDDMQWTDPASAGLLFHLGRRLAGTRILIVGTYRPEEVALGRPSTGSGEGGRHPLEKALGEFKRQLGDVWLDLSQTEETERRRFVDALLTTVPNRLGEGFRRALALHTGGHPLFTVELLQTMQERGDLVKDTDGAWVQGQALDWETLPARVEAVIEERVRRLSPELRDILAVASVEGEDFTAQVVAQLQGMSERQILRLLSQELEKRHRLVREQGSQIVDGRRLSRYRFAHALFQQHLYNGLGEGERALLHREVAAALEEMYAGHAGEIAVQLTHHFARAGDAERERHYAGLAAEWAAAQYAHNEAVRYLSRALELTPETDHAERYDLLLAREDEYDSLMDREAQAADLAMLELLADAFEDDQQAASRQATVLLRRAKFAENTGDFAAALAASQAAVRLAQTAQDVEIEAEAHWQRALILDVRGEWAGARSNYERALALAQAAGNRRVEAACYRCLGFDCGRLGDWAGAETYLQQALTISREMLHTESEGWTLRQLGRLSAERCDYVAADAYTEQAITRIRQAGWQFGEAATQSLRGRILRGQGDYWEAKVCLEQSIHALQMGAAQEYFSRAFMDLGCVLQDLGDYASARVEFERALSSIRDLGARHWECRTLSNLALLSHQLGDDDAALEQSQGALAIVQDTGNRIHQAFALTHRGHALVGLGQLEGAADAYRRALEIRDEVGPPPLVAEVQAGLARVALAQGDALQALVHVEEILTHLETGSPSTSSGHGLDGTDEPIRIYLTCYRVLRADQDPRADEVLEAAHNILQARAAKIDDEELRLSYLENVTANRDIAAEWKSR